MRGNVVDITVGITIGVTFGTIVVPAARKRLDRFSIIPIKAVKCGQCTSDLKELVAVVLDNP
jgi:large-conductance mechanosensitive channel